MTKGQILGGFIFWSLANMHGGVIIAGGIHLLTLKQKKYLVGVG